jgi:hypothetical protein
MKGLAGAFTVGFMVDFVKRSIDSVDALNDIRDATGASIENISALEDIAARTGTTMDTVSTAMVKFNGVLKDVKPGSDSEKAFKALNLDIEELKRLDPAEALLKTATAFSTFADDGNKARIMQELFGKSLKDVAPFLKDLADKGELVAKVTTQQAEEAEKFNKQLFAMQKNVQDLSRVITSDLVIGINAATKAYKEFGAVAGLNTLIFGDDQHMNNVKLVEQTDKLLTLEKEIQTLRSSGTALDAALLRNKEERLKVLQGEIKTTMSYRKLLSGDVGFGNTNSPIAKVSMPDISAGGGKKGRSIVAKKTQEQIDKEKALAAAIRDKSAAEEEFFANVIKADERYQSLLNRLLAATPTGQFDAQQKDLAVLQRALASRDIDEKQYSEAVIARFDLTAAGLDVVVDKTDKARTAADEFGMSMASAFEDAIIGGKDFGDVLDGLAQDMLKMTIRKAVTDPMSSFISGAIGSFLPKFAVGTDYVPRDMVAMIHKGEKIIPAAQNTGASGQLVTVNHNNFTVGDVASVSMVRQAVANSQRQIAAAVGRNATYGS